MFVIWNQLQILVGNGELEVGNVGAQDFLRVYGRILTVSLAR